MALLTPSPLRPHAREPLRGRMHLLAWLLLAFVIVTGLPATQREARVAQVDFFPVAARPASAPGPALECEPRGGFGQRLAVSGKLLLRAILPGPEPAFHVPASTCRVQAEDAR